MDSRIEKRRNDMPELYRGIYDKAMTGKSRSKAMHAFCLECVQWQRKEVKLCPSVACPLYPYRPYQGSEGVGTDEESTNDEIADISSQEPE